MHRKKQRGFTLIEILLVISIVGLLAAVSVGALGYTQRKSRDAKRVSDLSEIRKAIEFGFKPGDGYPVHASAVHLGEDGNEVLCALSGVIHFVPDASPSNCDATDIYIVDIPSDPIAPIRHYAYTGTETTFCIEANLEQGTAQYPAGPLRADETSVRSGSCP